MKLTRRNSSFPGVSADHCADTGSAVGAAASQGSAETRSYHVLVRFDDGGYGTFVYDRFSPFQPGELVWLTPQGLTRR